MLKRLWAQALDIVYPCKRKRPAARRGVFIARALCSERPESRVLAQQRHHHAWHLAGLLEHGDA